MGYLLTSMYLYLLGAFLLGLLLGWILWGRLRGELDGLQAEIARSRTEADRLKGELEACGRARADLEQSLRDAEARLANTQSRSAPKPAALMQTPDRPATQPAAKPAAARPAARPAAAAPKAATSPSAKATSATAKATPVPARPSAAATAKKAAAAPAKQATKAPAAKATTAPATKAAPASKTAAAPKKATAPKRPAPPVRPDDLRRIIGIGPANEKLLHRQGVRTFAQIAAWKAADIKRIEDVLEFDGRIARERWVEQAKLLAAGDEKTFARRFPTANTDSNT